MADDDSSQQGTQSTQILSQDPDPDMDVDVDSVGDDIADTLCTLQPLTSAAVRLVNAMHVKRPEHVALRIHDLNGSGEPRHLEIALRFSSKLQDYGRGFSFGRSPELNDVVLDFEGSQKRISQIHFQIFVNSHNVLMLRDTSTNGTIVDGVIVGGKRVEGNSSTRTLSSNSKIEILSPLPSEAIRFNLQWPARNQHAGLYTENFGRWINLVHAAEKQAWAAHVQGGAAMIPKPPGYPGAYINPGTLPRTRSMFKDQPPNMDDTFGMVWDGGSEYKCVGQIGSGAFATVYQVSSRVTGDVFAVKELEKRRFVKNGLLDHRFDNEMQIMRSLRHPHIVQFIDCVEQRQHLYIIMELIHFGDLQDFIKQYGNLSENLGRRMSFQMLDALDYLHGKNITHRDIKPENILISDHDPFTVKLTDFGLSKVVKNEETFLKTFCGTLLYCAPEVFPHYDAHAAGLRNKRPRREQPQVGRRSYSQQIDIWSYGVVLWTALAGMPPFEGKADATGHAMFNQIMTAELETWRLRQLGISEEAIDLIAQMLDTNPTLRPTEENCFQHPWLAVLLEPTHEGFSEEEEGGDEMEEDDDDDDETSAAENLDASQLSLRDNEEDVVDKEKLSSSDSFKGGDQKRQRGDLSTIPRNESVRETKKKTQQSGNYRAFENPRTAPAPPRTPKEHGVAEELALKSSGTLGPERAFGGDGAWDQSWISDTTVAKSTGEAHPPSFGSLRMHTQDLTDAEYETFLKAEQRAVVVEHRLVYNSSAINATNLDTKASSAPRSSYASSLSGTEAMVKNLRVTSMGPRKSPSEASTDAPSTPKQTTPLDLDLDKEDSLITPKQVHFQRTTEEIPVSNSLFYDDDDTSENPSSTMSMIDSPEHTSTVSEATSQALAKISLLDLNSVSARRSLLPPISLEKKTTPSAPNDKENQGPNAKEASVHVVTPPASAVPLSSLPTFTKPAPLLGRLTTTPESFTSLSLPLSGRCTTWGRALGNTIVYADTNDTRIPKIGLEIWFHSGDLAELERDGQDWTKSDDLRVLIRTQSRWGITVNGVRLKDVDEEGTLLYGQVYTGDEIIMCYNKKSGEVLKFVCDFYVGKSAARRGAGEAKFVVCRSRIKG